MWKDVSFASKGLTRRGWLYLPDDIGAGDKMPTVMMAHGFSAVKEQGLPAVAARVRSVAICLLAVLGLHVWSDPVQAEVGVDLELLLAVDVSASVEASEYTLQTKGLAWAFRDPEVRAAIRRSGPRGIAVSVVQWAGGRDPVVAIDWTHLLDEQSVTAFAIRIAAMPRLFVGDDTWIGAAVHFSVREMVSNGFEAPRKVIDLSGDGGVEMIGLTQRARNTAVASGVVINGLAIENEIPNLHVFFRDNLIGGVGAFVMRASSYTDFAEIMRLKLIREIGKRSMAELVPRQLPSLAGGSHLSGPTVEGIIPDTVEGLKGPCQTKSA